MSEPYEDPHLSLTQKENKDREEIEMFECFYKASHLPVIAGTIVHQKEPLPDIRCDLEEEGSVEFELVQLVDEIFMKDTRGDKKVAGPMRIPLFTQSLLSHMCKPSYSSLPKELIVYISDQPMNYKGDYREWLQDYLQHQIGNSIYRRVWFFNAWDKDYFQVRAQKKF